MADDLLAHLLTARPGRPPADAGDLRHRLASRLVAARAAWPTAIVSDERFVAYLAERVPAGAPLGAGVSALAIEDLYLACACAAGDPGAIAAFESELLANLATRLVRIVPRDVVDEVLQLLRVRLLVAEPHEQAKIADFSGAGSLKSWLRVTAVREALYLMRRGKVEVPGADQVLAARSTGGDPEIEYFKRLYQTEFDIAFGHALASLTARQRNLLRHHVVHGLGIDRVALIYRVHRATAARWIARAEDDLLSAIRRDLMRRLRISPSECQSILRLIQSRIEVTLRRRLGGLEDESATPAEPSELA